MKKMKKIFAVSLVACTLLATAVFPSAIATAEEVEVETSANATIGEKIIQRALLLEESNPNRSAGSSGEREMAKTLKEMLAENGFFDIVGTEYTMDFLYDETSMESDVSLPEARRESQNVVGYIDNQKEKTVIIGSHYDAESKEAGNTGFFDNISGVATAFEVAIALSNQDVDYNILLAFWGAEEAGLRGSEYFISNLSTSQLEDIALYLNFDSLGVGDNLYIFTNEVPDSHEKIFKEEAETLGIELSSAPKDKVYTLAEAEERPFMHMGIASDNFYFTTNEVMCVNLFSGIWGEDITERETTLHPNISGGKNDNSKYIFQNHTREHVEEELGNVATLALQTLSREDFLQVMQESKESSDVRELFYDSSVSTLVTAVLIAIFAVTLVMVTKKLSKEVKPQEEFAPAEREKTEKVVIFGETVDIPQNPSEMQRKYGEEIAKNQPPKDPFDQ